MCEGQFRLGLRLTLVMVVLAGMVAVSFAGQGGFGPAVHAQGGPGRQIDVVFVFHLNQNIVPYANVGDAACYEGLIRVLLKHPKSKFVLHVSGTLIHMLQQTDPKTLQLIRDGIARGQFEVLGSTYAQNVMYSSDDYDNRIQIELHRAVLADVLGVSPVGFWNAERSWSQRMVPQVIGGGYVYSLMEDHMLRDSGVPESKLRMVHRVQADNGDLLLFCDDERFRGTVNSAVDGMNPSAVVNYLKRVYDGDVTDSHVVVYAEDAEATGLWDYERGTHPGGNWLALDELLTKLEETSWVKVTSFSEYLDANPRVNKLASIVDGQAGWMIGPSKGAGFRDWFDYNARSQVLAQFRAFYGDIRRKIQEAEAALGAAAAGGEGAADGEDRASSGRLAAAARLIDAAKLAFAAHQYEFGCIGVGKPGDAQWEMARAALVFARAAEEALAPTPGITVEDINSDKMDEVVAVTEKDMYVFSPRGGKLIYWIDLESGEELVGSANGMYYGEGFSYDAAYVPELRKGAPLYNWIKDSSMFPDLEDLRYVIRRRVGNDFITVGRTNTVNIVNSDYEYEIMSGGETGEARGAGEVKDAGEATGGSPAGVRFTYGAGGFDLVKEYLLIDGGVRLTYRLTSRAPSALGLGSSEVRLKVENGLAPDGYTLANGGKGALAIWDDKKGVPAAGAPGADVLIEPGSVTLANLLSGTYVKVRHSIKPGLAPVKVSTGPGIFAGLVNLEYSAIVQTNKTMEASVEFTRGKVDVKGLSPAAIGISAREVEGSLVIAVPTFVRGAVVTARGGAPVVPGAGTSDGGETGGAAAGDPGSEPEDRAARALAGGDVPSSEAAAEFEGQFFAPGEIRFGLPLDFDPASYEVTFTFVDGRTVSAGLDTLMGNTMTDDGKGPGQGVPGAEAESLENAGKVVSYAWVWTLSALAGVATAVAVWWVMGRIRRSRRKESE